MEDGLGLTTITRLLAIVTALSLSSKAIFALLVLRYLVQGVLLAFLALAVCLLCLWNVHLSMWKPDFNVIEIQTERLG